MHVDSLEAKFSTYSANNDCSTINEEKIFVEGLTEHSTMDFNEEAKLLEKCIFGENLPKSNPWRKPNWQRSIFLELKLRKRRRLNLLDLWLLKLGDLRESE